jgi:hypothetical protein
MIFLTLVHEVELPSPHDIMWRLCMLLALCTIVQLLQDIYITVKQIEAEVVPPQCPQLATERQRERVRRIQALWNDVTTIKQG